MNFKLKALVAAVAFAAAGSAFADIQSGALNPSNGEVVFYAYGIDASGSAFTYVKDLGVSFDTFVATPSYAAVNLSTDTNWSTFTNTAHVGNEYWGVFATQRLASTVSTAANAFSLLTTANNNNVAGVPVLTNTQFGSAYANANNGIAQINLVNGTGDVAANASYFYSAASVTAATASGNLGAYLNSNFASSTFINSVNVLGTTTAASFFDISRGAGTAAAGKATVANIAANGAWHLNGSTLDYTVAAAVPEPETYAMMAAGLLVLGAVARRRRA